MGMNPKFWPGGRGMTAAEASDAMAKLEEMLGGDREGDVCSGCGSEYEEIRCGRNFDGSQRYTWACPNDCPDPTVRELT